MTKSQLKSLALILSLSFLLSIILILPRGGFFSLFGLNGFPLSILCYSLIYFLFTIWVLYRYPKKGIKGHHIVIAILIGAFIFELPIRIYMGYDSSISIIDYLIRGVAILAGWGFVRCREISIKILISIALLSLTLWLSLRGFYDIQHRIAYGTFRGATNEVAPSNITFWDIQQQNILLTDLKGDYIVLNFFNLECSSCFKDFPEVQQMHDKLQNNNTIAIYSILTLRNNITSEMESHRLDFEYSFPLIYAHNNDPIIKEIGADLPVVVIYDKRDRNLFLEGISIKLRLLSLKSS